MKNAREIKEIIASTPTGRLKSIKKCIDENLQKNTSTLKNLKVSIITNDKFQWGK